MPADVDGAEITVVAKGGRNDVGFAVSTSGCDSPESLARQVLDLRGGQFEHLLLLLLRRHAQPAMLPATRTHGHHGHSASNNVSRRPSTPVVCKSHGLMLTEVLVDSKFWVCLAR
jgi:hypothetical protein